MLPLNKNPDFKQLETVQVQSEYYDLDPTFTYKEYWDWQALDNYIENFMLTIPGERVFNQTFGSPLFNMIFENSNSSTIQDLYNTMLTKLEYYVPIKVNRSKSSLEVDKPNHLVTILVNYNSNNGMIKDHTFARRVRQ